MSSLTDRQATTANLTIRQATSADLEAVKRLAGPLYEQVSTRPAPGRRYLLVLDAPSGGLAGAVLLHIERNRGHIAMLAIAPRFEGTGLEDRMLGVVEALCRAFGADTVDVPSRCA
jgi:N-acetylglutamate synthase-like GNAT family acetyltransferase